MGDRGTAKGALFLHARKFVMRLGGERAWLALLAGLRVADRDFLEGRISVGEWVPVGTWNRLMNAFVEGQGGDAAIELSRFVAAEDLNFLFKMLLKMGSPEFVLKRTSAIYLRYFDSGEFVTEELAPREWRLTLTAPTDEEAGPSEVVCTYGVCGWLVEALVRTGAKSAQVRHVKCRFHGAPRCEYKATW